MFFFYVNTHLTIQNEPENKIIEYFSPSFGWWKIKLINNIYSFVKYLSDILTQHLPEQNAAKSTDGLLTSGRAYLDILPIVCARDGETTSPPPYEKKRALVSD